MITAKIVELFFSLPFFKSFSISDEAYSALRDMISFLYQLDQFLNLELMMFDKQNPKN